MEIQFNMWIRYDKSDETRLEGYTQKYLNKKRENGKIRNNMTVLFQAEQ